MSENNGNFKPPVHEGMEHVTPAVKLPNIFSRAWSWTRLIVCIIPRMIYLMYHKHQLQVLSAFMHEHRDLLFIVADPKTDRIYMGYRDRVIQDQFHGPNGQPTRHLAKMLKASQFHVGIDKVTVRISETLGVSEWTQYGFFSFIADGARSIAESLRRHRENITE